MKSRYDKNIVAIMLLIVVIVGNIWSGAFKYMDDIIESVYGDIKTEWNLWKAEHRGGTVEDEALRAKDISGNDIPTYSTVASGYLSNLPFKQSMIEMNGLLAKNMNMREIYKNNAGTLLDNGYIAGYYSYTSTDYEIQQIKELRDYLNEKGIDLLYVNEPTKYIADSVYTNETGARTYINDNTDRFLSQLDEEGIEYIDLRNNILEQNLDSFKMFYKTDHHWTTFMGKMAAETIAEKLNHTFDYNIDLSLYEEDKFIYRKYANAWLGEQGKKMGESFAGLDDFTLILPDYDTFFRVSNGENIMTGSFGEVLVDQGIYLPENNVDIYNAASWHYSYMGFSGISGTEIENLSCSEKKKILVIGDSYEAITVPFLALGVSEISSLILRGYEGSLIEYINNHDIDTVVIAYASFMIGAHDNETSANYSMFDFQ